MIHLTNNFMKFRSYSTAWLLILCFYIASIGGCAGIIFSRGQLDSDARINYYTKKVAHDPQLYPVYVQLASTYLDKACDTHDPDYLKKARSALECSMEIQPSFEAFKTMGAVCCFAHRFDEALQWEKRADEAWPADTRVTALMVEAYMGLGQYEAAKNLLPPDGTKPVDFHTAAAQGQWLASQHRYDEAVNALLAAASFAQALEVTNLVVWAHVRAAGILLDSGQPLKAQPLLEAAARLDPKNKFLRLHQAEFLEAEGQAEQALAAYEALVKEHDDPEIRRKAFVVARKLSLESHARFHFEAAEKGYQRAIDAGEIYTLGALAHLYCEADVHLKKALTLAQRNLEHKRDTEAIEMLACIRRKLLN